jgi:hypothetical protein
MLSANGICLASIGVKCREQQSIREYQLDETHFERNRADENKHILWRTRGC